MPVKSQWFPYIFCSAALLLTNFEETNSTMSINCLWINGAIVFLIRVSINTIEVEVQVEELKVSIMLHIFPYV